MKKIEFIEQVAEMIEADNISEDTVLSEIPTYDSLAVLNLLSLYDTLGVSLAPEEIESSKTVRDLVALAGGAVTGD